MSKVKNAKPWYTRRTRRHDHCMRPERDDQRTALNHGRRGIYIIQNNRHNRTTDNVQHCREESADQPPRNFGEIPRAHVDDFTMVCLEIDDKHTGLNRGPPGVYMSPKPYLMSKGKRQNRGIRGGRDGTIIVCPETDDQRTGLNEGGPGYMSHRKTDASGRTPQHNHTHARVG